jgi:hypothetical protein
MWWFIFDAETNVMQIVKHSLMMYSAGHFAGSPTLLLDLIRHGGWRWKNRPQKQSTIAGGQMWFIAKVFDICSEVTQEDDNNHSCLFMFLLTLM